MEMTTRYVGWFSWINLPPKSFNSKDVPNSSFCLRHSNISSSLYWFTPRYKDVISEFPFNSETIYLTKNRFLSKFEANSF